MSPGHSRGGPLTTDRPTAENPGEKFTSHGTPAHQQCAAGQAEPAGLFEVIHTPSPPDVPPRAAFVLRADDELQVRGPGRRTTSGPQDAGASHYWWAEAERVVMALIDAGHTCTADTLHERFPDEPSASGAAFGGLFARLAHEGRIVERGWAKSTRPAARSRRIIVWGLP